jgi:hypothetical protein
VLRRRGGPSRRGEACSGAAVVQSEARESVKANGARASYRELRPHPREPKHGVDTQHPRVDLLLPLVGHGRERVQPFEL